MLFFSLERGAITLVHGRLAFCPEDDAFVSVLLSLAESGRLEALSSSSGCHGAPTDMAISADESVSGNVCP